MYMFRCRMWPGFVIVIPTLNCHLKCTTRTTSQRKWTALICLRVICSKDGSVICVVHYFQGRSRECYCRPWPWRWATWPGHCTVLSSEAGRGLVASCWWHEKQWVRFLVPLLPECCRAFVFANFCMLRKIPCHSILNLATNIYPFEVAIDKLYQWHTLLGRNVSANAMKIRV